MSGSVPANWTYHGYLVSVPEVPGTEEDVEPCQIAVEIAGFMGRAKLLRRLQPPEHLGFNWGYRGGTGPQATADAVLSDALGGAMDIMTDEYPDPYKQMTVEFRDDVVAHFTRDRAWHLDRSAVLWWLRGWLVSRELSEFPEAVRTIGPVQGALYKSRHLD